MKKDITELYSFIDDFCKIYLEYEQRKLLPSNKQRNRCCSMSLSEMLTIIIMFHTSYAKNFKFSIKVIGTSVKNKLFCRHLELNWKIFNPFFILRLAISE
uniref:hypothetical protein n=1 Tax=Rickettsia endosymbiont of Oedothorax gibbosus TaxID=931099 RepID=UPI0020253088|nr:hypothetical protein [Rickettsia endosymbiont of Oedothorax gibbosus]